MLKLENISKFYYSSTSATCALRKINLEFSIGEFVAISGESGSGKTTLLNLISGFDSYEEGELYYNDKPTSYFDEDDWEKYRKEEIAFIFQHYNLIESYSVLENVIVTYVIDGYSYKDAKSKAKEILKLVGLDKDLHKKAANLSGGQKQRLSIARALAKETNIIIADEPTGNLDAENGLAILTLLKELSKDKLVIIVTHNQAQIEPFATRKIRLHDGEILIDEKVSNACEVKQKEKINKKENKVKIVSNFSYLNIKSQPIKTLLLLMLVAIMTFATFIFLANFKTNLDESQMKKVSNDFFMNLDETRILVNDDSNDILHLEALEKAKVDHVVSVEKYDLITDVNYYRSSDYKMIYGGGFPDPGANNPFPPGFVETSSYVLTDHSHFMRSHYSLSDDMIKEGRMPTGNFEMVVYSDDPSIIGTKELVFFRNAKNWGEANWYQYEMTIVGILKTPTEQAYFSDDICKVMELTFYEITINVYYDYYQYHRYVEKFINFNFVVIDPSLGKNEMSFPLTQMQVLNAGYPDVKLKEAKSASYTSSRGREFFAFNYNFDKYLKVHEDAIGLSYDAFEEIYKYYKNRKQFAVFIDDYAYTDDVIESLSIEGFNALSCFRASSTGYDTAKVIFRYVNLVISVVAMLFINVLVVMIALSIMKSTKNKYIIFKMIGLSNDLCKKISFVEVIIYCILSNLMLIATYLVVNGYVANSEIRDVLKYIKVYDMFIVFAITMLSMLVLGNKFSKYITSIGKITSLKEE